MANFLTKNTVDFSFAGMIIDKSTFQVCFFGDECSPGDNSHLPNILRYLCADDHNNLWRRIHISAVELEILCSCWMPFSTFIFLTNFITIDIIHVHFWKIYCKRYGDISSSSGTIGELLMKAQDFIFSMRDVVFWFMTPFYKKSTPHSILLTAMLTTMTFLFLPNTQKSVT